jgi:hypothetical protein
MCCAVPNAEEEKRQEVATSDRSFLFLEKNHHILSKTSPCKNILAGKRNKM